MFSNIRNEVLIFVNKIAEIVHTNVHNWRGQCNKNLGKPVVCLQICLFPNALVSSYFSLALSEIKL